MPATQPAANTMRACYLGRLELASALENDESAKSCGQSRQ